MSIRRTYGGFVKLLEHERKQQQIKNPKGRTYRRAKPIYVSTLSEGIVASYTIFSKWHLAGDTPAPRPAAGIRQPRNNQLTATPSRGDWRRQGVIRFRP